MGARRSILSVAVVLYFIIALEVFVMISPFAAFFYAAFDPVLLFVSRWPATRWLAGFFLPHMISPPDGLLKAVRVAGSALFLGGGAVFLVCAGQVYFHKLVPRTPAVDGLYAWIRHPQYVSLVVAGLGLAILWPRFLTIVLWTAMIGVYYALAKDEERRMLRAFGETYRAYQARTGAFLPRRWEAALDAVPGRARPRLRATGALALVLVVSLGSAWALRSYTVARLPLWSEGNVSVVPVLPADAVMLEHRMKDVLELPPVASRLPSGGQVLAYFVPEGYVMQGMIADTEPAFRLYEHPRTLAMVADWILHPFRHLEGGHAGMHHGNAAGAAPGSPTARRIIFLEVEGAAGDRAALFSLTSARRPVFLVDVDVHTLTLLGERDLGPGTGWGRVPTPTF